MQRRQFLQKSVPLAVGVGVAGCTDSSTDTNSAGYTTDEVASNEGNAWDDSDTAEPDGNDPALEAPPRESEVFAAIESGDGRETVVVTFEANPVVQARIGSGTTTTPVATHTEAENTTTRTTVESTTTTDEESSRTWMDSLSPGSLLPVGVAAGRGRGGRSGGGRSGSGRGGRSGRSGSGRGGSSGSGRSSGGKSGKSGSGKKGKNGKGKPKNGSGKGDGKTKSGRRGSGTSAFVGRNGRFKWHGGRYAAWHDQHDDELDEYDAVVSDCGVGHIGSADATEDDLPGVGAIDWDSECDGDHAEMRFTPSASGWYRVGARLRATDEGRDFGWEAVDVKIVETDESRWEIASQWKVSPRL